MRLFVFAFLGALILTAGCTRKTGGIPHVSSGKIVRIADFRSKYIQPRNIDVWLPDGYGDGQKYAVLYMNDGQMLFDSTVTWNKQEWQVDEVASKLIKSGKLRNFIVVGIFNNTELRQTEYFPKIALDGLSDPAKSSIIKSMLFGKPLSDNYLKFIVEELKPQIDSTFTTLKGPEDTYIMGSSMGGLISLYALCMYPNVFGGAACMSTHWPMTAPGLYTEKVIRGLFGGFRDYLEINLPFLHSRKFYFDYGTETLDSVYRPFQMKIDSLMIKEGYNSENWVTREFPGAAHNERSWAKRLNYPLEFLLGK